MGFSLFKEIKKQQFACFTGKLNIQKLHNKEWVGCLILKDGHIVSAKFKKLKPINALVKLTLLLENDYKAHELIIEPELVSNSSIDFSEPESQLIERVSEIVEQIAKAKKNMPPNDLRLYIRPEFVARGGNVTPNEFSLMKIISEYNLVKDIYTYSDLLEYEITNSLISLRKKEALKVVKVK